MKEKNTMKKIIRTLSRTVQAVLLAPIKLPAKVLGIIKYVAIGLGIIESVIDSEEGREKEEEEGKSSEADAEKREVNELK